MNMLGSQPRAIFLFRENEQQPLTQPAEEQQQHIPRTFLLQVPNERFVFVPRELLPRKGKIIVQAYQGKVSASYPVEAFLYTDDWSQIRLANNSKTRTQFRLLYLNPIEMYLKLIICKNQEPNCATIVVMNALGQPLRCSGSPWPFGIRSFDKIGGGFDIDFFDWEGQAPIAIELRSAGAVSNAPQAAHLKTVMEESSEEQPSSSGTDISSGVRGVDLQLRAQQLQASAKEAAGVKKSKGKKKKNKKK